MGLTTPPLKASCSGRIFPKVGNNMKCNKMLVLRGIVYTICYLKVSCMSTGIVLVCSIITDTSLSIELSGRTSEYLKNPSDRDCSRLCNLVF